MKKVVNAIGKFFVSIWNWIKNTAWVQPLLIVALIFGVIFSIQPISNAIKAAQQSTKELNFYNSHRITYENMKKKVEEVNDFIVIYESETCANCEKLEKIIHRYYTNSENRSKIFYAIDIDSDEFEDNKSLEGEIIEEIEAVYNQYTAEENKNPDYQFHPEEIVTPTLVRYVDGAIFDVRLGINLPSGTSDIATTSSYTDFVEFAEATDR